jgi:hypothetical protein
MANLDEQPGPLGGIVDDTARKELRRLWDTLHNRLGYADPTADHVLVTQADLRAVKLSVTKRFEALPTPPKVGAALIGGSSVSTATGTGGAPSGPAGGDLTGTYPNPALVATTVVPGTYGDATHVGQFTVDGKGRLTFAQNVVITGAAPTGAAGGDLTGTYPNPTLVTTGVGASTYGDSTHVAQITVDAKGRITAASNVAVTPGGAAGGDLTGTYPNPTLVTSGVTAASYGDASHVAQVTFDAKGRATAASSVAIAIAAGAVSGLAAIATSGSASDLIAGTVATARLPALPWGQQVQRNGKPDPNEVLLDALFPSTWTYTLPAGCTGSWIMSRTAHTNATDYDLQKDLVSIGTIHFAAGGTVATYVGVSLTTFTGLTDSVQIIAPATPDPAGANLRGVLYFTRA